MTEGSRQELLKLFHSFEPFIYPFTNLPIYPFLSSAAYSFNPPRFHCSGSSLTHLPNYPFTHSLDVFLVRRDHGQQQNRLFHEFEFVDGLHSALYRAFAGWFKGNHE